jgi:Arc/MetJ-type ribon-helix-helix transcriptional regulator
MATVTCKISDELDARLESAARDRRVSKSAVLREALERRLKANQGRGQSPKAYDLVKRLCGSLRGPRDLSTNPKHMMGLGGQSRDHR